MALFDVTLALTLAWLGAFAPRLVTRRWTILHHLAAFAVLYPAASALVSFVDLAPLLGEHTVLRAYTSEELARIPLRIVRRNLLVPLLGLAAVALAGGVAVARSHLRPALKGWPTWRRELRLGLALAPVFIVAEATALLLLAGPLSFLQAGDESAAFANATVLHVLALSLVPALAEELYYRGLLQSLFEMTLPSRVATWGAIALQGLIFGLAHAGFTTFSHLLGPLAFGLAMGYLRATVGLGACIVVHASVNLFYFSVDPGAGSALLLVGALLVTLAGLAVFARERRAVLSVLRSGPETSTTALP